MDLLEYQGKQLFAKHGVAVPSGEVAATVEDAVAAAERIGYPCAIKAQVLIGGRGKAGGIKIAQDAEEARAYADAILGMDIIGPHGEGPFRVDQVWIEGGSDIASEYYASVILDRGEKKLLAMVSRQGRHGHRGGRRRGPRGAGQASTSTRPGPSTPPRRGRSSTPPASTRTCATRPPRCWSKLAEVASDEDANLIEVNPLIVTNDREVVALDAKVTIDGNALFRHQDLAEIADTAEDPQEAMAKEKGLTYVKLDGNVGILANGAGLCMSTLDVVAQAGGAPANFLDAGGGSKAEAIVDALDRDHLRREGHGDPLQHLRRHHPLRRDRQGHRRRLAADRPRSCRWSCASTAPTPRRGWRSSPRPTCPTCSRRRRCSAPPSGSSSWRRASG